MLLAALLLLQTAPTAVPAAEPVDWAARLRTDATAFRDAVLDSHPGPVDAENPGFKPMLERAHARALERAKTTSSFAHYAWALRELTAAFDDGHVGVGPDFDTFRNHPWKFEWPGFVTALRGDAHVVASSEVAEVPVGAALVGCDGTPAAKLAEERIGRFEGRWMLRSRRASQSGQLFLPPQNPWIAPMRSCTFSVAGQPRKVRLSWRPIDTLRRSELLAAAVGKRHTTSVGLERLADGTVWINLGSFDSDAASPHGAALAAVRAQVVAEAASIRAAPRIVFDLRGNNGGSSSWASMMAQALWGPNAVDRAVPDSAVDWRTSDANYRTVEGYVERFGKTREANPSSYGWAVRMEAGLRGARQKGLALWRQEPGAVLPADPNAPKVTAKVFVLTDFGCGSACLDAVDVLTAMGAAQVGQETAADTQYMEIRQETLASGGRMWIPMKVYRGRRRGSNEPAVPKHFWTGSMSDTEGLRKWIAGL